ncbi:unnamed protein product, partial [Symbiodinium necroappetens]
KGCRNDVDAVEEALHRCCSLAAPPRKLSDAAYEHIKDVFETVLSTPDSNRCVFVFFAGHGIQTGRGTLLVPCDAEKQSAKKLVPVEWIRQSFRNKVSNGILILVLACCRHPGDSLTDSPLISIPSSRGVPKSMCDIILYGCGPSGSTLETEDFARRHDMPTMHHSKLAIRLTSAMWRAHFESLPVYRILEIVAQGCEMDVKRWDGVPEMVPRFQDERLKYRLFFAHPNANPGLPGAALTLPIPKAVCHDVLPNKLISAIKGPVSDFWQCQSGNLDIKPQVRDFLQKAYELKERNDWNAQMKWLKEVVAESRSADPVLLVLACTFIIPAFGHVYAGKYPELLDRQKALMEASGYVRVLLQTLQCVDLDDYVVAGALAAVGLQLYCCVLYEPNAVHACSTLNDAWQLMVSAGQLHMKAGLPEISMNNLFVASRIRLFASQKRREPGLAHETVSMMQSVMECLSGGLLTVQSPAQDFEFKLLGHIAGKIRGVAVPDIQGEWFDLRSRKP